MQLVEPPETNPTNDAIARVLKGLDHVRATRSGWVARCPAHEDNSPSLSVSLGVDGRVLVHCFAGCTREQVVRALGLQAQDLRPPRAATSRRHPIGQFARAGAGPGIATGDGATDVGLTLADLTAAKHLPLDFLHSVGCSTDRGRGVRIPYHDADGNLAAVRTRLALTGDRFRWRKGDRPLPYGMWRLADARAAGWLLLVEGETDCWTLWHQGVPGLGIPGKSTWREDWATHLVGLDILLWQEPDAEDLTERVARDLPNLRVVVAPPGIKDLSEAHLQGVDVKVLIDRLRAEAHPVRELLVRKARERLLQAHEAAQSVLAHPDPLELVETEIRAQGYGGDVRVPLLGYLAATSRVLAPRRGSMLAHTLFKGPSSGGKNAALQAGLRLLPADAVHVIDAGSPRVLIYDDAPLEHRVVVFGEADSLPAGEDNPAASAIRNLLQDGHLHYRVTVRDPATGKFTVHTVDKSGPTVLMTTSTRTLGNQLMTRLFTVEVPDEPAQLRAALAAQAALELDDPPPPNEALVAFQRYIGALAPIDVVVPFSNLLADWLGRQPAGPRVLRDFPRLLSLLKATAVLRHAHRTPDARGRLAATIDDYGAVHRLLADTYEASAGASKRLRETAAAVGELTAARGADATVNVSELAMRLNVSIPSASRRVRDAIEGGWLVNDETRRSQTARLRLGEPLPSSSSLPTPDELAELFQSVLAENAKTAAVPDVAPLSAEAVIGQTKEAPDPAGSRADEPGVFTFSSDPVASQPPVRIRAEGSGRLSAVDAEDVRTADRATEEEPSQALAPPAPSPASDDEWIDVAPVPPEPEPNSLTLWDLP